MKKHIVSGIAAAIMTGSVALAAPISLPQAQFGINLGTTIDNSQVLALAKQNDGDSITLGLSATSASTGAALANDGNSTFFVPSGAGNGGLASWSFDYYATVTPTPGTAIGNYTFVLLYSLASNVGAPLGQFQIGSFTGSSISATAEGSQNLGNGIFAGNPALFNITPPAGSFNPLASGTYVFTLEAFNNTTLVATNTMTVAVLPDAGSSSLLLGLGLAGLAAYRCARRQSVA